MQRQHHESAIHILCPGCYERYREAIERWADRRRVIVSGGRTADETVCTACHGRLEANDVVLLVRWENAVDGHTATADPVTP